MYNVKKENITKEPVYTDEDMLSLSKKFNINLDDLVIRRYDELLQINDSIRLFDSSYETRKELDDFFMKGENLKTISPEFVFLCLKFNPKFYNFAQLLIFENKRKKKNKNIITGMISKIFNQKTK